MFRNNPCQRSGCGFLQAIVRKVVGRDAGLGVFFLFWVGLFLRILLHNLITDLLCGALVLHNCTVLSGNLSINVVFHTPYSSDAGTCPAD